MFQSLWSYLRAKAREAVLSGVSDAVTELESDGLPPVPELPEAIRGRLLLTGPVPVANGRTRGGKVGA